MKIKLLHEQCRPYKKHACDAGIDLKSRIDVVIKPHTRVTIPLGVRVAVPEGYVLLLFPRSSMGKTPLRMCNSVGVIDSGYTGEIMAMYENTSDYDWSIGIGDRIAQAVIVPCAYMGLEYVKELESTERGDGGFGSTNN